jgi:hypothetical protein
MICKVLTSNDSAVLRKQATIDNAIGIHKSADEGNNFPRKFHDYDSAIEESMVF